MQEMMKQKALSLLADGTVTRVLGWKKGNFVYDITPAVFESAEEVEKDFVYSAFCGSNLSKYLVKESRKEGKILVFLKPCDSYSFAQLQKEHRVIRENVYAVGIECYGKADIDKIRNQKGAAIVKSVSEANGMLTVYGLGDTATTFPMAEVLLEKCESCKSKLHVSCDELLGDEGEVVDDCNRFDMVAKLEAMPAVTSARPAPAKSASSITMPRVWHRRPPPTALKRICSTSSVPSTWWDVVPIAASAAASAPSRSLCTC